jgi:hypothetical protein
MALGPGKYDALCTEVREKAHAVGAVVLVFDGQHGSGFSAQLPLELTLRMPTMLRDMADEIERTGAFSPPRRRMP